MRCDDSGSEIPLGAHTISGPLHEPPRRPPQPHLRTYNEMVGLLVELKCKLQQTTYTATEIEDTLGEINRLCECAQREADLLFEENESRFASLRQEADDELSRRDTFIARVVERARAAILSGEATLKQQGMTLLKETANSMHMEETLNGLLSTHMNIKPEKQSRKRNVATTMESTSPASFTHC